MLAPKYTNQMLGASSKTLCFRWSKFRMKKKKKKKYWFYSSKVLVTLISKEFLCLQIELIIGFEVI